MINLKTTLAKTWIFIAAAAVIAGSGTAMSFALNSSIPASSTEGVLPDTGKGAARTQAITTDSPEYTVVDLSKSKPDQQTKDLTYRKLRLSGITDQQIEAKYQEIIANTIPGEKDMKAEQAAAYGADIVKKAYGTDLAGYKAEASFCRNPVPNSDNWTVIFHAPQETDSTNRYIVSMDSVSGLMLSAGFYTFDYREDHNENLRSPDWVAAAAEAVTKLLPENTALTKSRVIAATKEGGVMVLCELSDGSAFAVRLTGEEKDAAAYQYFPNGYDGSWDYHPPTENGVG